MHPYPLEPTAAEMHSMGQATLALVEEFINGLPESPAADLEGAVELADRLRESAPEAGAPFSQLLDTVALASQKAINNSGPGFLAYIPGGGLYTSALADLLAAGFNRYVNLAGMAPAIAQIEATAVRWLCDLFDYPADARGVLTSGGSMANFSAVVAARKAKLGEDFSRGVLYTSQQSHASCAKAGYLAGFPKARVRLVPTDDSLRMDEAAFAAMVAADRAAGLRPFMVTASAGTTNTGSVDPIAAIGELARANDMWLHVDAAYGGPFRMTEYGRKLFAGIELADSITLDPHKALFIPYGTGALIVREGARLRDAHHVAADYLQDMEGLEERIPSFSEYSMELSRDFRGLRLWLPIKLHGMAAFRDALEEKLELARYLHDELRAMPGFEVPLEPDLTAVAFRYVPDGGDADAFNQRLLQRINDSKRVFLSSTNLGEHFVIRACVVSHRTHRDRIEEAVRIIRDAARDLAAHG
ncbi:pyridoxal phosphate-dependent decarboxylase family protein [Streptomyces sp. NPDC048436]|uniref:pyridoxal phosphate-dependent decarboxylase family protein n=1 Tax=Streptomyces sp. NPDC048436 TaxID=3365550 RepID=UPI0037107A53